jgi:hypothetical protein
MARVGGFFVLLFGIVSTTMLVQGLLYGITGQVIASLMLLSATIFTAFKRPSQVAARARRRAARTEIPSLAT